MKQLIQLLLIIYLFTPCISIHTQAQGLEDIIVETYYISDMNDHILDCSLPKDAVTYRIFIDMAEGYSLQAVYGVPHHEWCIETTTRFYNSPQYGATIGYNIKPQNLNEKTVAFDSWLTLGLATKLHTGVIRDEDWDGSLIYNELFEKADGLVPGTSITPILYELDMEAFDEGISTSNFKTRNSVMGILGGIRGATSENRVLIAQITTNGELSFKLNVQLGTSDCGEYEQYVAKDPVGDEILFDKLRYGKYK